VQCWGPPAGPRPGLPPHVTGTERASTEPKSFHSLSLQTAWVSVLRSRGVVPWEVFVQRVRRHQSTELLRAIAVTNAQIAPAGVWVPDTRSNIYPWIEEHVAFPAGGQDDQVDTTAIALGRLRSYGGSGGAEIGSVGESLRDALGGISGPVPVGSDTTRRASRSTCTSTYSPLTSPIPHFSIVSRRRPMATG
jgi:hypothetical protein